MFLSNYSNYLLEATIYDAIIYRLVVNSSLFSLSFSLFILLIHFI